MEERLTSTVGRHDIHFTTIGACMTDIRERVNASFHAQGLMSTLGATLEHVADGEVHIALLFSTHLGRVQSAGRMLTVCTGEARAYSARSEGYKVVALIQATIATVPKSSATSTGGGRDA